MTANWYKDFYNSGKSFSSCIKYTKISNYDRNLNCIFIYTLKYLNLLIKKISKINK